MKPLLEVEELTVQFDTMRGPLKAVDRVSFSLNEGQTLGIVGESGCGKSITSMALMRLLPPNAKVSAKRLVFEDKDLLSLSRKEYRALRGGDLAMIFQDPMTSLNPSFTVGYQITEALQAHGTSSAGNSRAALQKRAVELLDRVGIPDPETRLKAYPHQLSGGMCQRVMIAIAVACKPKLLIADEPTTALDVTIQAQIMELLRELQKDYGMALMLITHDLGVVSEMADRLMVMYAGQVVEQGVTREIIDAPSHPYTEGLLSCLPATQVAKLPGNASAASRARPELPTIPGLVPDLVFRPSGCQMHPRCKYADDQCRSSEPAMVRLSGASGSSARNVRCIRPLSRMEARV